jgi:hypothetical protein
VQVPSRVEHVVNSTLGRGGYEVKEKAYVYLVCSVAFANVTRALGAHFDTRWHHDVLVRTGSSRDPVSTKPQYPRP